MEPALLQMRVLLVEDSADDAYLLTRELKRLGFDAQLFRVETASEMRHALKTEPWDIVLSDYSLPHFNAPEALQVLKEENRDLPFIIVSGTVGEDTAVSALKAGAGDFILKGNLSRLGPAIQRELAEAEHRIRRREAEASWAESERRFELAFQSSPSAMVVLDAEFRFVEVNRQFSALFGFDKAETLGKTPTEIGLWVEKDDPLRLIARVQASGNVPGIETTLHTRSGSQRVGLLSAVTLELHGRQSVLASFLDITERKLAELAVIRSRNDLASAYESTLQGWARALELRDAETEGHSKRVTDLTVAIAELAGIRGSELANVRRGALLHDIGKMGIPDSILLKPGVLTDEEWKVMRRHPIFAYEMLSSIDFLEQSLDIPLCHHEKWDGTGYPRGLSGEEIPFAARLFAVVDVWDALSSSRPYKPAWEQSRVREHLRGLRGSHFDPEALRLFERALDDRERGAA